MNEIRKIIREAIAQTTQELDEDAKRFSHLPEGTALFIDDINAGYDFYLYNPKEKKGLCNNYYCFERTQ